MLSFCHHFALSSPPEIAFAPTLGRDQRATIPTAASELHSLLAVQALAGVPLLVLANKNDLPEAMGVDEMIGAMGLERIRDRAVSVSTEESPLLFPSSKGLGLVCAGLWVWS